MSSRKAAVKKHRGVAKKKRFPAVARRLSFHEGVGSELAAKPPVKWNASPNFASRNGTRIDSLVLHNTDGTLASAIQRFKDSASQVSAHYIVDRDGSITQMVNDSDTAWHSGNRDRNQRSVGIEVVAYATALGMTARQQTSLVLLGKYVLAAYSVPLSNVLPHRDIKPTDCPGWVWPTDAEFTAWTSSNLG
jgi:N-acetyl-anhydromuramyl-L-alanine amidase AmpD